MTINHLMFSLLDYSLDYCFLIKQNLRKLSKLNLIIQFYRLFRVLVKLKQLNRSRFTVDHGDVNKYE